MIYNTCKIEAHTRLVVLDDLNLIKIAKTIKESADKDKDKDRASGSKGK